MTNYTVNKGGKQMFPLDLPNSFTKRELGEGRGDNTVKYTECS